MAEGDGRAAAGRDSIVITGATATGKTAVAVAVAAKLGGEVISMDSRQVYRGMDIGTAKPTAAERAGVRHHGFDLVPPDERFNAGRFAVLARGWLEEIRSRGAVPVFTGGTGFFLRALTHPMFDEPPLPAGLKEHWKRFLAGLDTQDLARWAGALDPAAPVRPQDRQRLARVIEVAVLTGRPLSWWHAHAPAPPPAIDPVVFVLDLPREQLYHRIEERVHGMVAAGLMAEVEALLAHGYTARDPGINATGYIEMIPCLRGEYTLEEAVARIQAATRRYARRQLTWLRHQLPPTTRRLDATMPPDQVAEIIAGVWREGHQ